MLTEKQWQEIYKNIEKEIEEGVMKVTKEFVKNIRKVAMKQKETRSIEEFTNSLGIEPKHKGKFDYTVDELDNCEIEIIEE